MSAGIFRKILAGAAVLSVVLMGTGCGNKQEDKDIGPLSGTVSGEEPSKGGMEESSDAGKEPEVDLSVLADRIQVEAGTEQLSVEDFFVDYQGEEATLKKELTAGELAMAGETYVVPVEYKGHTVEVTVEIVDTTAPAIAAEDIAIQEGDPVSYKKTVSVTDNSSAEPSLEVDHSEVKTSVPGVYTVRYTATDASGNTATAEVSLTVTKKGMPTVEEVNAKADELIAEIVTPDMTLWDATFALWDWCRTKIQYSYSAGDTSSIYAGAYEGLYERCGDCYTYYATFAVLLDRMGIENMGVTRVGGETNHYWNLVNLGDGWYHCDSSPRYKEHTYFCFMQTDAQIQQYTESYPEKPNYYTFDPDLLPERATKIVYEHY